MKCLQERIKKSIVLKTDRHEVNVVKQCSVEYDPQLRYIYLLKDWNVLYIIVVLYRGVGQHI